MKVAAAAFPEVKIIKLDTFADERGEFVEIYRRKRYADAGIAEVFAQDNLSRSRRGVLRGLHFQEPWPQGKLVQAITGTIWDVVVDVRRGSPSFGHWMSIELTGDTQLWVPPKFAHGFCVLSDFADVLYKCTHAYMGVADRSVRWNDPALGIAWPIDKPILSAKDASAPLLAESTVLPVYEQGV